MNEVLLDLNKYDIIVYGNGISNEAVKTYLDDNHFKYSYFENINEKNFNGNLLNIDNLLIIKSPGIPPNDYFLDIMVDKAIIVTDIDLFYLLHPFIYYIGVTGTLGKTTQVHLLELCLKERYPDIVLAGNVGIPIFDYANSINYELPSIMIIECSSFELEFAHHFHPNIMIYLNFYSHHLDHHLNYNSYLNAKLTPIKNMNKKDYIIYPKINRELFFGYNNVNHKTFGNNGDCYLDKENQKLVYANNLFDLNNTSIVKKDFAVTNFMSVFIVLCLLNVDLQSSTKKVKHFVFPKFRQEIVFDSRNLTIINDSKSTTIYSTIAALSYIMSDYLDYKKIVIMGGKLEKIDNLKIDRFIDCYLYGESRFYLSKKINGNIVIKLYETLEEVFQNIKINCLDKIVILFSPGFQSYDQFNNYIERGNYFNNLANKLIKNVSNNMLAKIE